jgi:hypothetical protein
MQLVRWTRSSAFLAPPVFNAFLSELSVHVLFKSLRMKGNTYLMELAPTHQPRHLVTRLILFKANNALLLVTLRINAVLLSSNERKHSARRMCHAIRVARPFAGVAHAAGALGGKTGRCLLGKWYWGR